MIGDALGMIAGRHGDDAAAALIRRQRGEAVQRATFLERGGELQVLEFEPDLATKNVAKRSALVTGGFDDRAADGRGRRVDVCGRYRQADKVGIRLLWRR